MSTILLLKALDLIAMGIEKYPEIKENAKRSADKIRQIISEGRDPTPEELDEIDKSIDLLRQKLHSD